MPTLIWFSKALITAAGLFAILCAFIAGLAHVAGRWLTDRIERISGIKDFAE